jgi:glucose-1-phosphate adenylyltransferase
VHVGTGAVVGFGENLTLPNKQFPKHLYTGITLIGKEARIPAGVKIGRNCIVNFGYDDETFGGQTSLADGESI